MIEKTWDCSEKSWYLMDIYLYYWYLLIFNWVWYCAGKNFRFFDVSSNFIDRALSEHVIEHLGCNLKTVCETTMGLQLCLEPVSGTQQVRAHFPSAIFICWFVHALNLNLTIIFILERLIFSVLFHFFLFFQNSFAWCTCA